MKNVMNLQSKIPVEEITLNPLEFTVSDIIDIANLLKKDPTEVFESILNDLNNTDLIQQCEQVADDLLVSKNQHVRSI